MKHLWSQVAQPFQTPLHILEPKVRNNTQQNHEHNINVRDQNNSFKEWKMKLLTYR